MQTRSPFLDEIAKAVEGAIGVAQAAGEEARTVVRAQADRWVAELDLVRRDEFEAMRALYDGEIAKLRAELAHLKTPSEVTRPLDDAG